VTVRQNPAYPRERVLPGAIANLMSHDWDEMTRKANASANHVKSLDRWVAKAREANPALNDEQAERLGQMMRTEHYRRMGRLSVAARRRAQS
jgi:hypothetical protein